MLTLPVPDYFQEEGEPALRARVQWLGEQVGLGDAFFARLLHTDEESFVRWRTEGVGLPRGSQPGVQKIWDLVIHILSFLNFDTDRARQMLEHIPPPALGGGRPGQTLPWAGSSIKTYLEMHGADAVDEVERWVTAFRFGAPSLSPEQEVSCRSTQG